VTSPTGPPNESPIHFIQRDNEETATQPRQLAQSDHMEVSQPLEHESDQHQRALAASPNSVSLAGVSDFPEPIGTSSSAMTRPAASYSRFSVFPGRRPPRTTSGQSPLGNEKSGNSSERARMDSWRYSQQLPPKSETRELRTQSQPSCPRMAWSPSPTKRLRYSQTNPSNLAPTASWTRPNRAPSTPVQENAVQQPGHDDNRSHVQSTDPNLAPANPTQMNFSHLSQGNFAQSQANLGQLPVPVQASRASPPGTPVAATQTNVHCPTPSTQLNFSRPPSNYSNLAPPTPSPGQAQRPQEKLAHPTPSHPTVSQDNLAFSPQVNLDQPPSSQASLAPVPPTQTNLAVPPSEADLVPSVPLTPTRRPAQFDPNIGYPAPRVSPYMRSPAPPSSQTQGSRASPSPAVTGHGSSSAPSLQQVPAAQEPALEDNPMIVSSLHN